MSDDPSDNDLLRLLAEIEAMALRPYPFAGAAQHDPRLPFALGRIAGIAGAVLVAAPQDAREGMPEEHVTRGERMLIKAAVQLAHEARARYDSGTENAASQELTLALSQVDDASYALAGVLKRLQLEEHIASPTCWCNPVPDGACDGVWIHNYQPAQHAALQGEDA